MTMTANAKPAMNKRAKLSPQCPNIDNIPEAILIYITSYIRESTQLAILGVSLTASSAKWRASNWTIQPSEATQIIFRKDDNSYSYIKPYPFYNQSIYFGSYEKELASKMSDDDLGAIFACFSAVRGEIERVCLTNCVNIIGFGLEPLRGSTSLESLGMDIPSDGNQNKQPSLCGSAVIPILDSIIEKDGSSLNFIELPETWQRPGNQNLDDFLERYNNAMNSRRFTCSGCSSDREKNNKCGEVCRGTDEVPWVNKSGEHWGTHNYTCHGGNEHYCIDCVEEYMPSQPCTKCKAKCCAQCIDTLQCDDCEEISCHECTSIGKCEGCQRTTCDDCCYVYYCECCEQSRCCICVRVVWCDHPDCYDNNCIDCTPDVDSGNVRYCQLCNEGYCSAHLVAERENREADTFCSDCNEKAGVYLSEWNRDAQAWVKRVESKYGIANRYELVGSGRETFSRALEQRKQLRQYCIAVRDSLLPSQKAGESFDWWLEHYFSRRSTASTR